MSQSCTQCVSVILIQSCIHRVPVVQTLCFSLITHCALIIIQSVLSLVVPSFCVSFSRVHSAAPAACFSHTYSLCFSHTYSLCFIRTHSEWLFCLKRRAVSEDYDCLCKLTGLIGLSKPVICTVRQISLQTYAGTINILILILLLLCYCTYVIVLLFYYCTSVIVLLLCYCTYVVVLLLCCCTYVIVLLLCYCTYVTVLLLCYCTYSNCIVAFIAFLLYLCNCIIALPMSLYYCCYCFAIIPMQLYYCSAIVPIQLYY